MRKLLSTLILALACISSAWATVDDEDPVVYKEAKVYTAKELVRLLEGFSESSLRVNIQLMADIDMAEVPDYEPASNFDGMITGYYEFTDSLNNTSIEYHVIKNLKTNLVKDMTDAKVSGITFLDGERGGKFYGGLNACFLCKDAKDCEFTDIILMNCHYEQSSFGGDWYASTTGLLTNTMNNCKVTNVAVMHGSIYSDGSEIGGITGVATNGCKFTDCLVDGYSNIYTEKEPDAYIGGLVGICEDCTFVDCTNMALVSASPMSDNLGGITGKSTRCSFTDCTNIGTVTQMTPESYTGFRSKASILFKSYTYEANLLTAIKYRTFCNRLKFHSVKRNWVKEGLDTNSSLLKDKATVESYGAGAVAMLTFAIIMTAIEVAQLIYDSNAPDEVGGISAASYACTFEGCTNTGLIVCRDAYCGGIVGYADTKDGKITKINNCINTGYVQGGEQTGGIVGYLKDSHATNCFNAGAVDCLKGTKGPIYGDTNAKGATITTCFAMVHGAKYEGGAIGGEGVIVKFSEKDVLGGRAAYEMNRLVGKDLFRQKVGEDRYPNFTSDVVKASDIRNDVDLVYHVTDAGSFCDALIDPYSTIELQNDIDFEHNYISLYRSSLKYRGTIDGKGHTIKNIKIEATEQDNKYDQKNERRALIQFAEGATFKNLTLDNMTVKRDLMIAGLVGNSKNCTYEDINITNSTIYAENSWVGGLVYESDHDTFTRCTTDKKTSVSTHGIPGLHDSAYAGGLAGKAKSSTFTDCVNGADVSGKMDVVGGIVAQDENSTFTRCVNEGYIHHESWLFTEDDYLGGIVADAKNSKFYECINSGKLKCEENYGGGIVGYGTNVTILNCLNTSKELQFIKNNCGGIIGYAENSMIANCASLADRPCIGDSKGTNLASGNNYRVQISNDGSNRWEATVSEKVMASGLVCRWLNNGYENRKDGRIVWYQVLSGMFQDKVPFPDGSRHPEVLTTDLPHDVITSADQLVAFAKKVNGGDNYACAVLANDIDLSTIGWWTPIGNHNNRFQGVFDGQGHTISGMSVNINSNDVGAGLFGVAHMNAEIRNVYLSDNCNVHNTGEAGAGGILGRFHIGWVWGNVVIENCGSSAKVSAKKHAGGIVGRISVDSGTDYGKNVKVYVNNCFNMGDIYASESNSGLLIGYAQNSGHITNCWSAGSLKKMNESNPVPYSSKNPKNETEYFAGYDQKISIVNCYAMEPLPAGQNVRQDGVQTLEAVALTDGHLTYRLNRNKTEGDLDWYQKIGVDARPMLSSRGGDIVYLYLSEDNKVYYTNDNMRESFDFYGAIRVKKDKTLALLEANSQNPITLNSEIEVGRAELNRSFTANVPSTLVLPFSGEIDSESSGKFFSFSAMNYDEENNKYTAVMDEVEGGKFEAYTPYLALFAEDTADSLVFENVTLKPVTPAVTQKDEWYFIGATAYKAISLQDEESQYYYGYAGMAFDGFKLGEFARLGEGASIAPFRCYMRHIASEDAPDSFDVITRKAPTRAAVPSNPLYGVSEEGSMPSAFDVILKGANGETGIATFDNETGEFRFEGWYDLNGNRVDENYSGVRVGGGKKVIVKE